MANVDDLRNLRYNSFAITRGRHARRLRYTTMSRRMDSYDDADDDDDDDGDGWRSVASILSWSELIAGKTDNCNGQQLRENVQCISPPTTEL